MNPQRRLAALGLAVAAALATVSHVAQAQAPTDSAVWPTKPVRLVVPALPGTAPDVVARIVGERLSRLWGQPVVIENRPGAGGMIAFAAMKSAKVDDHLFAFVPASAVALSPYMFKSANVDILRDLVPVAFIGESPMVLAVRADSPYNSVADLLAQARKQPDTLVAASPVQFSVPHLTTDLLSRASGTSLRAITYAGSSEAASAVIGGDAQLVIDGLPALDGLVKGKRLKLLATFGASRLAKQPGLPAVAETYPEMVVNGWFGMLALNGTSARTIERVNRDVATVLAMPEVIAAMEPLAMFAKPTSVAGFAAFLSKERSRWEKALRDVGAQPITP